MAKKSKTQRAKASVRRAEKREHKEQEELVEVTIPEPESEKKKFFSRSDKKAEKASEKEEKKAAKPEKKAGLWARFRAFIKNVRTEMHRVTWPTRQDVVRWSGVVVVALIFFGLYVFVLDNWIVTPILMGISSLGA